MESNIGDRTVRPHTVLNLSHSNAALMLLFLHRITDHVTHSEYLR